MALIELDLRPDPKKLRTFGLIGLVALGALAGWAWWRHALFGFSLQADTAQTVAVALGGAAGALGLLALVFPAALRGVYVAMTLVTFPIGLVVSHAILIALYYGVVTPIGVLRRLFGRDPLTREIDRTADTYWVPRRRIDDVERYFRQY